MKVGIGHSDNPDTHTAGAQAAMMAIAGAERSDLCDMVLLFSTVRHDQQILREAVISTIGKPVPVYGGGAIGIITNDYFGYAGDQIGLACIWLDGVDCKAVIEGGMQESEKETGIRLGQELAKLGIKRDSPVMLFYDALGKFNGLRMLMATWLLEGIEKSLGFFPDLTGAGLMGDFACNPTMQWTGDGMGNYNAIALAFSGDISIDSVIMHGCRPATQYYTVTKAAGQVILEINGKPAIQFVDELLDSSITPEQYPFFLIFGVNHGDRWGEYDEDYYASRLCLGIDKTSGGIVMFEPDMVEGTEFRLMFRSLDLDYIKPKIDKVFNELDGREPVFAIYIDCAGRCAGYGGMDMEDALAIQKTVARRVPVLGLYTGVEIASIGGRPRSLDWTGVFCLFSQSKNGSGDIRAKVSSKPVWNTGAARSGSTKAPVEVMARLAEQNAAKILSLDTVSVAIRGELEQKRRGFRLLAELSVSLRHDTGYESVFIPVAKRINAALNMQRTIVLARDEKELFTAEVLQGYSTEEKTMLAGRHIKVPSAFLDHNLPVLVTGAEPEDLFKDIRELFGLPYFTSYPIILQNEVYAILITGRLVETSPYFVRLSHGDAETVQAIGTLLASVIARRRLTVAEERNQIMVDAAPMCCVFWDEKGKLSDCNKETLSMFGLPNKKEFLKKFDKLSPEYQPDGRHSMSAIREAVKKTFISGNAKIEWTHKTLNGELIPAKITLVRVPKGEDYTVVTYIRDLREQKAAQAKIDEAKKMTERYTKAKNEFVASVSHEIRTPLNAIVAMARTIGESKELIESQQNLVKQGMRSVKLLTSAIEAILDFSRLDSGRMPLETGEFSVREMIDDISGMAKNEASEKSLYFRVDIAPHVPGILFGDSIRLQQALLNIVVNAIKFTETGGVEISVFGEKATPDNEIMLTFEVRDTGIGISKEQISDLFKPLYSGNTAYDRKHNGLGLGLPISNSLATLMGGKIECESRLNEGSTFRLIVPLSIPEEKNTEVKEAQEKLDTKPLRGLRVLVAEDNNINQMIIEELLSLVGIKVTLASNGINALEALQGNEFDIVLMDIMMPEMDGLTAAAQIRANSLYDDLPILAMTANAGTAHLEESMRAGMNDHLTKPIDTEQLYKSLMKWGRKSFWERDRTVLT